ncbi:MAG: low-density lipoprotein receptor class A repeat-containing protein [Myxococcota bacterium]
MTHRSFGLSLLMVLGLAACDKNHEEELPRQSGGPGFVDVTQQMAEVECSCLAAIEGPELEAECLDTYAGITLDDGVGTCIDRLLDEHPDAVEPFACILDAEYDLLECALDWSCSAFTCADGETISDAWVCDGEPDCDGGEDEQQRCPAPFSCGDQEIPDAWVCDGWEDCADGSDEPTSCAVTCQSAAVEAMLSCAPPPESFEDALLDECFDFEVDPAPEPEPDPDLCSDDGDCDAPPSAPPPDCDDGACAHNLERSASAATKIRPRRSRAMTAAARHTLRPR